MHGFYIFESIEFSCVKWIKFQLSIVIWMDNLDEYGIGMPFLNFSLYVYRYWFLMLKSWDHILNNLFDIVNSGQLHSMSHRFFNFVFYNFRDVSNVSSFEKYYKYRAISFLSIISLIQILILNQNWYLLIKHYYLLKRKTKLSLINNFLIFPTIHQITWLKIIL